VTLVLDATVVVAALLDAGPEGDWARDVLVAGPLAAPHLLPVEVANVLRRASDRGEIGADSAALAHAELLALPVELFPYEGVGDRVWELRHNVTCYDAWYVALAEALDAPLATLDDRLTTAPGLRCSFLTPG
jgi:predicted nucleic acid-binding protein